MGQHSKSTPSNLHLATADIAQGLSQPALVIALAYETMKQRFRRTFFGVFWLLLNFLMFLLIFVLIFGYFRGFRGEALKEYAIHVGYGWVVWGFLSGMVTGGASSFANAAAWIKGMNTPLSIYVLRDMFQEGSLALISFMIMIAIAVIIGYSPGWVGLWAIAGIMACAYSAFWLALLLATLSSRFRDIQHFLNAFMRAFFFTTPIIWTYDLAGSLRTKVALFNPFTHYIEVVRGPMSGLPPDRLSWIVVGVISAILPVISLFFFARFRRRIPLWV
ncbi:MAG: ABC transporter permease [bacterium]